MRACVRSAPVGKLHVGQAGLAILRAGRAARESARRVWWSLPAGCRGRNRLRWRGWRDRSRASACWELWEVGGCRARAVELCGLARRRAASGGSRVAWRSVLRGRSRRFSPARVNGKLQNRESGRLPGKIRSARERWSCNSLSASCWSPCIRESSPNNRGNWHREPKALRANFHVGAEAPTP